MDLNESISNDWTFMKRQIKPPLKIIGRENTDNIILVERNVHKWGVALRSSNPVSLSSRTNMAIQTLQLQIKVITVITKVCLSWPKINATELHFARSFQGYPTRPYLVYLAVFELRHSSNSRDLDTRCSPSSKLLTSVDSTRDVRGDYCFDGEQNGRVIAFGAVS